MGIQDGQTLRITGKGKTDTLFGFTGSLLVAVRIIPEKTPVVGTADVGDNQLSVAPEKPKLRPKKAWTEMTDAELRNYIAVKGNTTRVIWAIIVFLAGTFMGIGVPPLGFAMWGITIWLIVAAVIRKKNAKKAEEEYFNRRKK